MAGDAVFAEIQKGSRIFWENRYRIGVNVCGGIGRKFDAFSRDISELVWQLVIRYRDTVGVQLAPLAPFVPSVPVSPDI